MMKRKSRAAYLWVLLAVIGTLPASVTRADIKVTRKPAEVEHKVFDHKNPPKDVHGLENHEGALTTSEFDCQIGLNIAPGVKRPQPNGKCQQSMVIQDVKVTVALKIVVWLPDDATEKLKAHEEGHRDMAETIYKDRADRVARSACKLIDGRRMTAEAANCDLIDKAIDDTIMEANKKVYNAYLSQTAEVSARAGDLYDEITKHGERKDIDEKAAEAQAFARQAEEEKHPKGATTKPGAPGSGNPAPVRGPGDHAVAPAPGSGKP